MSSTCHQKQHLIGGVSGTLMFIVFTSITF